MMKREKFEVANIYVPVKRRSTLKAEVVQEIARSILESGQETPILVRRDGDRLVLVHGLHRLEACKALGEETGRAWRWYGRGKHGSGSDVHEDRQTPAALIDSAQRHKKMSAPRVR